MTTITDNFNRADEDPVNTNWTTDTEASIGGNFEVVSNVLRCTLPKTQHDDSLARHNTSLSGDDHYVQADYVTDTATSASYSNNGLAVRMNTGGFGSETCYAGLIRMGNGTVGQIDMMKFVSGSETALANSGGSDASASDTVYFEADGSDLDFKVNSSSVVTDTDSSITGNTRVGFFSDHGTEDNVYCEFDDFEGGDLGAGPAGTILPQVMHHYYEGPA